jgi:hypothetical protein
MQSGTFFERGFLGQSLDSIYKVIQEPLLLHPTASFFHMPSLP